MTTINDLYQELQDKGYLNLAAGTFDLPASNSLGSADITKLLGDTILFPDGEVKLTGLATPKVSATSITLSGQLAS